MNRFKVIEAILNFDNHRSSEHSRSVSTSELIGAKYKAWKSLNNTPKNYPLPVILKRSSTLGTGYHLRAEEALADNPDVIQERFNEKYIKPNDVWLSGTFDIVVKDEGKLYIGDHKTFYGKKFKHIDKTAKQLSVYRWLNQDIIMEDKGYIYGVSQSNNEIETIEVDLMPLEDTEHYVLDTLDAIMIEPSLDCFNDVKYNPCTYCEYECTFRKIL